MPAPYMLCHDSGSACKCMMTLHFGVQRVCKACLLLEGLNQGLPKLGISRSRGAVPVRNGDTANASSQAGFCLVDGSIAGQTIDSSAASVHADSAVAQHPSARTHRQ